MFLHQNRTEGYSPVDIAEFTQIVALPVIEKQKLKHLFINLVPWICRGNSFGMVQFLHNNRTEGFHGNMMLLARDARQIDIELYLQKFNLELERPHLYRPLHHGHKHLEHYLLTGHGMDQFNSLSPSDLVKVKNSLVLVLVRDLDLSRVDTIHNIIQLHHQLYGQNEVIRLFTLFKRVPTLEVMICLRLFTNDDRLYTPWSVVEDGRLDAMLFVHFNDERDVIKPSYLEYAARYGHLNIIQFYIKHRKDMCYLRPALPSTWLGTYQPLAKVFLEESIIKMRKDKMKKKKDKKKERKKDKMKENRNE
ncbi:hypothetical protein SAMD00019534_072620 [Acytostelium subglobosum LB1]|uniref:hypothetical protein n=1 Tax=Acytostelium subglobosum LB1 TaxID=1410327 RepID=UPI000644E091|nr:hypothetical protein SAMD00019534_072620 [Acytostelium subglobosum LB1]GAM24087.1 hypothetical protein SAMD00019534_072620 [Acytostelium subglobosum LB1]|eukprot:XP_012753123.1 hypothetical protein SAMD00019534_072620 [Acytostelium subglobosum LB1]